MKMTRCSEAQILAILRQAEGGVPVSSTKYDDERKAVDTGDKANAILSIGLPVCAFSEISS